MAIPLAVMAGIKYGLPALGALGGLFSNRKGVSEQTQNQSFNNTTNFTNQGNTTGYGRSTPTYDPAAWNFRNELMGRVLNRPQLADPRAAAASMTTQNIQGLNQQSDLQRKAVEAMMRQRGLSYSPMGGTMMGNFDANRIQQATGYLNQQPLLERQFEQENETMMNNRQQLGQQLFSMIPYSQENENFQNTWGTGNQNQYGTSNMKGTSTSPANKLGGMFSGFANTLAGLYGNGAFGGRGSTGPTAGGVNPNYQLPRFGLGGF
jgi:hypothetical protein